MLNNASQNTAFGSYEIYVTFATTDSVYTTMLIPGEYIVVAGATFAGGVTANCPGANITTHYCNSGQYGPAPCGFSAYDMNVTTRSTLTVSAGGRVYGIVYKIR